MKTGIKMETLKKVLEMSESDIGFDDVVSEINADDFEELLEFAEEYEEEVAFFIHQTVKHVLFRLKIRTGFASDID